MKSVANATWLTVLIAGCGSSVETTSPNGVFIALQKDFADFTSWQRFDLGVAEGDSGSVHASGTRVIYLNTEPAHGSTSYPVGTIVVKVIGRGIAHKDPYSPCL